MSELFPERHEIPTPRKEGVSIDKIREKSGSFYFKIEVEPSTTMGAAVQERAEAFAKIISPLFTDKVALEKIINLPEHPKDEDGEPNNYYNSPELAEYLLKVQEIFNCDKLTAFSFATSVGPTTFLKPRGLVKEKTVIDIMKGYAEAVCTTEYFYTLEKSARDYITLNNPQMAVLVSNMKLTYTHPDVDNFSTSKSEEENSFIICLSRKEIPNLENKSHQKELNYKLMIAHELYHGIFDTLVGLDKENVLFDDSYMAFTEGFATIMELHLMKDMSERSQVFSLTKDESTRLDETRKERINYLKSIAQSKSSFDYWNGTKNIFHKVLKAEGVSGLIEFCKKLDKEKLFALKKTDPLYQKLLADNEPVLWLQNLGKVN